MTGGGTFDPTHGGSVHVSGAFHVLRDIGQGPLTGLKAGEGVRWEARAVLASTGFLCTGAAGERLEQAFTDDRTVVFDADFYRHSDHNQASLHARIFISTNSPAVWVQGVGCVDAQVNLH